MIDILTSLQCFGLACVFASVTCFMITTYDEWCPTMRERNLLLYVATAFGVVATVIGILT